MPIKIGVLIPNSTYIPFLARDIPQALKLALAEYPDVDYELCFDSAGYNAEKQVLAGKIQELIVKEQVDVILAPLNAGLLEAVKPFFSGQQIPLIVNTLGEDVIPQEAQDPYLFINSFNLWQTSWLSGYWGVSTYGQSACNSAALHDAGYGMGFSFAIGVEAQGGQLVQTAVTHRDSRTEDPSDMLKMIAEANPDFIMGFYSGKEAVSFLKAYHQLGMHDKIPLMGLPFMVDESLLNEVGEQALGIRSFSCWRQDTPAHQHFAQPFQAQTDHPVNCYVLMAYETGHLIAKAVQQIGADRPLGAQLPEALQAVGFDGPRGPIQFDSDGREVETNNYLREVVQGEDGQFYNKVIEEVETPPLFHEQLALARKNIVKQGWLNPYLIA